VSGLVAAVGSGCRQYETRTRGGAYLYRVTQYYGSWPFAVNAASNAYRALHGQAAGTGSTA
jgi:hypothetical protein